MHQILPLWSMFLGSSLRIFSYPQAQNILLHFSHLIASYFYLSQVLILLGFTLHGIWIGIQSYFSTWRASGSSNTHQTIHLFPTDVWWCLCPMPSLHRHISVSGLSPLFCWSNLFLYQCCADFIAMALFYVLIFGRVNPPTHCSFLIWYCLWSSKWKWSVVAPQLQFKFSDPYFPKEEWRKGKWKRMAAGWDQDGEEAKTQGRWFSLADTFQPSFSVTF